MVISHFAQVNVGFFLHSNPTPSGVSCPDGICVLCGQIEYSTGSADRGRTIFEGLVTSYPKRLDLWNMYVDQETKAGHIDEARRLLDRMCTLNLSAQKVKSVFKKYLRLEMQYGDEERGQDVKRKAQEYVEARM